ncbi:MAG TPA: cellulose biosynthesis protein BcsQ [Limnobacter sp.]|nr:cellulose biosynthesis protein BcsQ [Limnobacter sp.]
MIIIAIASATGGAGRTSLAIAAANQLAQLGRQVVLMQADPANNLEFQLGSAGKSSHGLGHVLLNNLPPGPLMKTAPAGFRFLPFGPVSVGEQMEIEQRLYQQQEQLTRIFQDDAFPDSCVVLIDLPRWPSPICQQVMALADLNLVALVPDSASVLGIDSLLPQLLESRGASYFLMNRFDSSKVLHLDLWTLCKTKLSHRLLPFYLHEDQALPESLATGLSLADYAPRSQLVEDQQKLCNWIDLEMG